MFNAIEKIIAHIGIELRPRTSDIINPTYTANWQSVINRTFLGTIAWITTRKSLVQIPQGLIQILTYLLELCSPP